MTANVTQAILRDALAYWERRRIAYNVALALVVAAYWTLTWPHFRPVFFHPWDLFRLGMLAVLANLCYTAAYLPDLALQFSGAETAWRRYRWLLFTGGTLFAMLLSLYWLADEIYPAVS